MPIPEAVIEQIRDRADIVEIVSGYVSLKKTGRNFKGLCPFHHEKTPSFLVSSEKQIYHCFGCGEGGNVLSFLMKMERTTFPETVEFLADRLGIPIPQTKTAAAGNASSQELYDANGLAARYYHEILLRSAQESVVRRYLAKRGISKEMITKFQIGFAPDQWEGLIHFAKAKGVSLSSLVRAGLALQKENGGHYDRFRNRLIFPIFDLRGRAVGFGGRVLDEEGTPKYLNSPETEVYQKGRQLYGLWFAKEPIREKDAVLIVEGYMDLIALYQHGVDFVTATCGTALTAEQIRLLKRFTHRVIVVYDGDKAGQMASLRGLDLLLEEGCQVRLMDLPAGQDPDDFVRASGAAVFRQKMQEAKDLLEYKLGLLMREKDIRDPYQKSQLAREMLATIHRVESPVSRGEYLKQLSERIHVREQDLWNEWKQMRSLTAPREEKIIPVVPQKMTMAEKLIIRLVFEREGALEQVRKELQLDDFENEQTRSLMKMLFENPMDRPRLKQWLGGLQDVKTAHFLSGVLSDEEEIEEPEKSLKDCVRWLKQNHSRKLLETLKQQIMSAQTERSETVGQLLEQYQQVLKIHQQQSR
ncbi:MAG: DNA primase [Candidatus Omnitrophica bacterium]|nr:DNA primase [Candidatus Omnitrophota bacterium]